MNLKEVFGSNIRQYRKSLKITQEQFAVKTDLSDDMISRVERGVTGPSFTTIDRMAEILNVPVIALFSAGTLTLPHGERGEILQRINLSLSKMNEDELVKAAEMLKVLKP